MELRRGTQDSREHAYTRHGSSRCSMRKFGARTRRRRCSAKQRRPISARYSMIPQALCIKIPQQNSRRFAARQAAASLQHAVQASMREAKSEACRSINDHQQTCGCKPTAGARHTSHQSQPGRTKEPSNVTQQCLRLLQRHRFRAQSHGRKHGSLRCGAVLQGGHISPGLPSSNRRHKISKRDVSGRHVPSPWMRSPRRL